MMADVPFSLIAKAFVENPIWPGPNSSSKIVSTAVVCPDNGVANPKVVLVALASCKLTVRFPLVIALFVIPTRKVLAPTSPSAQANVPLVVP